MTTTFLEASVWVRNNDSIGLVKASTGIDVSGEVFGYIVAGSSDIGATSAIVSDNVLALAVISENSVVCGAVSIVNYYFIAALIDIPCSSFEVAVVNNVIFSADWCIGYWTAVIFEGTKRGTSND